MTELLSRPERAMQLTVKLKVQARIDAVAELVHSESWPDRQTLPPGVWYGPPQKIDMLRLELSELKKNMGGSERRAFAAMLAEWKRKA